MQEEIRKFRRIEEGGSRTRPSTASRELRRTLFYPCLPAALLLLLAPGLFVTPSGASEPSIDGPDHFVSTGSMGVARLYVAAARLKDGRVLVVGGHDGASPVTDAEIYDPVSDLFGVAGSLAVPRMGATATTLYDGRVLLCGGWDGSVNRSDCEVFDPATQTFAPGPGMNSPRSFHTSTELSDATVLFVGGFESGCCGIGGTPTYSAELFDPVANDFSATATPMVHHRAEHSAARLPDGRVLVVGGYGSPFTGEIFDPATRSFILVDNGMVAGRTAMTALTLPDGKVLVAGGYSGNHTTSADLYDPATNSFSQTGSVTDGRTSYAAVVLPNGRPLLAGGEYGNYTSDYYDAGTAAFIPGPQMVVSRYRTKATLLEDGRVLIPGGHIDGAGSVTATAELFVGGSSHVVASGPIRGDELSKITVLLYDSSGAPVSGVPVSLSASGSGNAFAHATGTSDALGRFTTTFSSSLPELKTITAAADSLVLTTQLLVDPRVAKVADPDIVGSWDFEETGGYAFDGSIYGNHGQLLGISETLPLRVPGRDGGTALRFDGSSYVDAGNDPSLEPGNVTVEMWVRSLAAGSPGLYNNLIAKGADDCWTMSYGFTTENTGGLAMRLDDGNRKGGGSRDIARIEGGIAMLWDGEWHHVAGSYDGTWGRLYLDGREIVEPTGPYSFGLGYRLSPSDRLTIGNFIGSCVLGFHGDIDDVRIWRRALNAVEVIQRFLDDELQPCDASNTPPVLGDYADTSVPLSGHTSIGPSLAPSDDGAFLLEVSSPTFGGTVAIEPATGVVTISDADAGIHTFVVTAMDNCGATASTSFVLSVVTPTIVPHATSRIAGARPASSVIASVSDPEDAAGSLTVTAASVPVGLTLSGLVNSGGTVTAEVGAVCEAVGSPELVVQVENSAGITASASVPILVTPNDDPVAGVYPAVSVTAGEGSSVVPLVGPSDSGSLSLSVSSTTLVGALQVDQSSGTVHLTGESLGEHVLTVVATDSCGSSNETSFLVRVSEPVPSVDAADVLKWSTEVCASNMALFSDDEILPMCGYKTSQKIDPRTGALSPFFQQPFEGSGLGDRNMIWWNGEHQDYVLGGFTDRAAYRQEGSLAWAFQGYGCCNYWPGAVDHQRRRVYWSGNWAISEVDLETGQVSRWLTTSGDWGAYISIANDSMYLSGFFDGSVARVDLGTNTTLWRTYLPDGAPSLGAVGSDGSYVLTGAGDQAWAGPAPVYRFEADGALAWVLDLSALSEPVIDSSGMIYVGTHRPEENLSAVVAIAPNGTVEWVRPVPGRPIDLLLGDDGRAYALVVSSTTGVVALDRGTGAIALRIENLPHSPNAFLLSNGVIYTSGHGVNAIDLSRLGSGLAWSYEPGAAWPVRQHDNQRTASRDAPVPPPAPPARVFDPYVVGSWDFEETGAQAFDGSIYGNHGQLLGTSGTIPLRVPGRDGGTALRFDGSSYVDGGNDPSLEPANVTIEMWVRSLAAASPGFFNYLIAKGEDECWTTSYGLNTSSTGGLAGRFDDGNRQGMGSHDVADVPGGLVSLWNGEWHHVATSYDGTYARLYLDGQEFVPPAGPRSFELGYRLSPNDRLTVGAFIGSCVLGFHGDIDDVRIWRKALTGPEVGQRANGWELGECPAPSADILADGATRFCGGGSVGLIATNGWSWLWSNGETTQSIQAALSGSYSVEVTDWCGAVAFSTPIDVEVLPVPVTPSIAASGATTFCEGGTVTLTASPVGQSYVWSTGAVGDSITVSANGTYWVTATNDTGCSVTSQPIAVTVHPLPQTPTISTEAWEGIATLTSSPAFSYLWTTGETAQAISTSTSGSYAVTTANEYGCAATSAASSVVFSEAGQTSLEAEGVTVSPSSLPGGSVLTVDATNVESLEPLPDGYFQVSDESGTVTTAYEISMDPPSAGTIEIAFDVAWVTDFTEFMSLRILHGEEDPATGAMVLVDVTVRHEWHETDASLRRVVASVSSLSPFVIVRVKSPTIDRIDGPAGPVALESSVALEASFTDPDLEDLHTASWEWGDGTSSFGFVTEPVRENGIRVPGSVSDTHTYAAPGVYTVTLTVVDNNLDGGSDTSKYQFVVVYDPEGGYVTGGGWIHSPAGTYVLEPGASGKASFGFVSRYQKGAHIPTGNTSFHFQAGSLRFASTSYEWLVVSGAKAQYKGIGTVNGAGAFGFLLTATDGQQSGGGGVDKFRIKVWDRATGLVVYDNVPGSGDALTGANPQAIGGGSVVIHSK